jgi:uncharacterized glyoxalase superfamily protein PhnB
MPTNATSPENGGVPLLLYRDLPAAINWLCTTLGFEKHLLVQDEDGSVRYAQLTLGRGMVMLAPVNGSVFDKLMVQPDEVNGAETQSSYFFVANVDTHYARAKSRGADFILDITDKVRAQRGYSCRDPEGHIWNFGTFNPWSAQDATVRQQRWPTLMTALSAFLSVIMVGFTVAVGCLHIASHPQHSRVAGWSGGYTDSAHVLLVQHEGAAPNREGPLAGAQSPMAGSERELSDALMQAHIARQAADRVSVESRAQLARQQYEKEAAEISAREARDLLAKEKSLRVAAERDHAKALEQANEQTRAQLAHLQSEIEITHIAALKARDLLAKEKSLRLAAERRHNEAARNAALARNARSRNTQVSQKSNFNFGW